MALKKLKWSVEGVDHLKHVDSWQPETKIYFFNHLMQFFFIIQILYHWVSMNTK